MVHRSLRSLERTLHSSLACQRRRVKEENIMATASRTTVGSRKQHRRPERSLLCLHQDGRPLNGRSRTVLDESGSLAITAWTCATCGDLIEEIRIVSTDGKPDLHPIRYTVTPQSRLGRVAAVNL
jgi:hypothetical protein